MIAKNFHIRYKNTSLLIHMLKMNLKKLINFRTSFLLNIFSSLTNMLLTVFFWSTIYQSTSPFPSWGIGQTFAFLGFVELFYALKTSFFIATGKIWIYINNGRIDTFLVRPFNPQLLMCLLNIKIENFMRSIPSIIILFYLALRNNINFSILSFISALSMTIVANIIYANLQMASCWLTFWIGKSQMLDEFTDSLIEFNRYPHTIFPEWMRIFLLTVIPFGLASTEPAKMVLQQTSFGSIWFIAIITLIAWSLIQVFLWHKGLNRYESYNG